MRTKHWLYFHYGFAKGAMKTDSTGRSILFFKEEKSKNCRTMTAPLKRVHTDGKLLST